MSRPRVRMTVSVFAFLAALAFPTLAATDFLPGAAVSSNATPQHSVTAMSVAQKNSLPGELGKASKPIGEPWW